MTKIHEDKMFAQVDQFISTMNKGDYSWNDIANCLAHALIEVCNNNINDISCIDKIVIQPLPDDLSMKIFVKETAKL